MMKMKLLPAAILLAIVSSCSFDKTTTELDLKEDKVIQFTADSYLPEEDGGMETKTSINVENGQNNFIWSALDTVGIYPNKGSQVYFEMTSGAGASSAEFDGGGWDFKPGAVYRSYYPFIGNIYLDATKIPVNYLGQKQTGNDNTDDIGPYDFMYTPATSAADGKLSFRYSHLSTIVKPKVELPAGHYTNITLSLQDPLFAVKGTYDLTSEDPSIVGKEFAKVISKELDVTLTEPETLIVWFMLAPINMAGKELTITVQNDQGVNYAYQYTPSKAYVKGRPYTLTSSTSFAIGAVTLDQTSVELNVNDTKQITATVTPDNVSDKTVTWSSSDPSVAAVSNNGLITALSAGTTTITATASDGNTKAECTVTVNDVISHVLVLTPGEGSVNVGETIDFTAQLKTTKNGTETTTNLDNSLVTWSSSKPAIATISAGTATGVASGTTTIIAEYQPEGEESSLNATASLSVQTVSVTGVSLNKNSLTFSAVGSAAAQTLTATITPSNATNKNVTWSSGNSSIATVDQTGKVTPVATGETVITVKTADGNKTASCTVTVHIPVTGITLNKSSLSLNVGATETLTATIAPSNASNQDVTWSSNKTSVATVDANGKVTAIAAGTATITATSVDGNKTATCAIAVSDVFSYSLELTPASASINVGASQVYTVKLTSVKNGNSTVSTLNNSSVTWSSSNTSAATISNGTATGVAEGTATITAKYTPSGASQLSSNSTLTVNKVAVTAVNLDKTSLTFTNLTTTQTLTATVLPSNATNKNVTWSSSNSNVATVSNAGVVTPKGSGTATITVTSVDDSSKKATCTVTVNIPVTGVTLNKTSLTFSNLTSTQTLTATVSPSNASNKNVTWSSSNTNVATVSNGVVTPKGSGTATITVTTVDGGKTATCTVSVNIPVTGVALSPTSYTFNGLSSTKTLTATVSPSNASNKNVTWSSSNTSVATVSNTGVVTPKGSGTATITVTTADGGKTATCAITVNIPVTGVTLSPTSYTFNGLSSTKTLTATVAPSNATNKNVSWTSSNTSVATVSDAGVVTPKGSGTATITVTTADGNKTATCSVTVSLATQPTSIVLDESLVVIAVGEKYQLHATVYPENATNKTVTWSVSDMAVDVSNTGELTGAVANYEVTVTATTSNGKTATCTVRTIKTKDYPVYYTATQQITDLFIAKAAGNIVASTFGNVYDSDTQEGVIYCNEQPITIYSQNASAPSRQYLTSIIVPSGVQSVTLQECIGLTDVSLPSSITTYSFMGCTNLKNVTIPNGPTSINNAAFARCSSLTTINIPTTVTSIGESAFTRCTSLANVTIPTSVTSIGRMAFYECSSLTSLTIPTSVTNIGGNAFDNCTKLSSFTTNSICPDGRAIVINNKIYAVASAGINTYTVPSGVTEIAVDGWISTSVRDITLPNSITKMTPDFYQWDELILRIKATTPPTIGSSSEYFDPDLDNTELQIIVPKNYVNTYKNATNWSRWATYIKAATNY